MSLVNGTTTDYGSCIENLVHIFVWNNISSKDLAVLRKRLLKEYRDKISEKFVAKSLQMSVNDIKEEILFYELQNVEQSYIMIHGNLASRIKCLKIMYLYMRLFADLCVNNYDIRNKTVKEFIKYKSHCKHAVVRILWDKYIRYRFEVDTVKLNDVYSLSFRVLQYCYDFDATYDKYFVKQDIEYFFGL